nr:hypothetical protein [Gammaproteobacteria bacterium]
MTMETKRTASGAAAAMLAALVTLGGPASAHHSFSIYDSSVTKVFTGVVTRVNPDANHLQIFFAPMNEERKNVLRDENGQPIIWAVEMVGSAQAAREGITVSTFPAGTIFSVALHPLRSGEPAGSRVGGALFRCPERTPPPPGKHCDAVEGHVRHGQGELPKPTE